MTSQLSEASSREAEVNEQLRSHVTRVGFDLTLGKTHIAALVYLNESIRTKQHFDTRPRFGAPKAPYVQVEGAA